MMEGMERRSSTPRSCNNNNRLCTRACNNDGGSILGVNDDALEGLVAATKSSLATQEKERIVVEMVSVGLDAASENGGGCTLGLSLTDDLLSYHVEKYN